MQCLKNICIPAPDFTVKALIHEDANEFVRVACGWPMAQPRRAAFLQALELDLATMQKVGPLDNVEIPACAGMTVNEKRWGFVPCPKDICIPAPGFTM